MFNIIQTFKKHLKTGLVLIINELGVI